MRSGKDDWLIKLNAKQKELVAEGWNKRVSIVVRVVTAVATVVWGIYGVANSFPRLELFRGRSACTAYAGAVVQGLLVAVY